VNLSPDATVRSQLLAAFITFRSPKGTAIPGLASIPPSAVAGIAPGTLYYAYLPQTSTYWAKATFAATGQAQKGNDYIGFQDGGATALFSRTATSAWGVRYLGLCDTGLPAVIFTMWSLPSHTDDPMCPSGYVSPG
jgi:hypothetical protein